MEGTALKILTRASMPVGINRKESNREEKRLAGSYFHYDLLRVGPFCEKVYIAGHQPGD